jgi:hypothetical protein
VAARSLHLAGMFLILATCLATAGSRGMNIKFYARRSAIWSTIARFGSADALAVSQSQASSYANWAL